MKKITKGARQMAVISFSLSTLCAGSYLIYKKSDSLSLLFKNAENLKDFNFDSKLFDDFSIDKFKEVIKNNNFDTSIGSLVSTPHSQLPPATSLPNVEEEKPSPPPAVAEDDDEDEDDEDTEEGEGDGKKGAGDQNLAKILQLISEKFSENSDSSSEELKNALTTLQSIKDVI